MEILSKHKLFSHYSLKKKWLVNLKQILVLIRMDKKRLQFNE